MGGRAGGGSGHQRRRHRGRLQLWTQLRPASRLCGPGTDGTRRTRQVADGPLLLAGASSPRGLPRLSAARLQPPAALSRLLPAARDARRPGALPVDLGHGRPTRQSDQSAPRPADDSRLPRRPDRRKLVLGLGVGEHVRWGVRQLCDRCAARRRPSLCDARAASGSRDRRLFGRRLRRRQRRVASPERLRQRPILVGLLPPDKVRRVRARQPRRAGLQQSPRLHQTVALHARDLPAPRVHDRRARRPGLQPTTADGATPAPRGSARAIPRLSRRTRLGGLDPASERDAGHRPPSGHDPSTLRAGGIRPAACAGGAGRACEERQARVGSLLLAGASSPRGLPRLSAARLQPPAALSRLLPAARDARRTAALHDDGADGSAARQPDGAAPRPADDSRLPRRADRRTSIRRTRSGRTRPLGRTTAM